MQGADVYQCVMTANHLSEGLIDKLLSPKKTTKEKAWEFLYATYYPMVKELVISYGGTAEDATDIFQDGLLILNNSLSKGTFRRESAISTYLFSICKNLWFREYNRRNKEASLQPGITIEMQEHDNFLINIEIVTVMMRELPENCRRILTEFYFNNRSMAELKEMFNVNSIQAAKNKKWRCLTYLERIFKENGVTPKWD